MATLFARGEDVGQGVTVLHHHAKDKEMWPRVVLRDGNAQQGVTVRHIKAKEMWAHALKRKFPRVANAQ